MLKNIIKNKKYIYILLAMCLLGFIIRFYFASTYVVHGDEESYLYSGNLILKDKIPFKDYHSRSPVFLYLIAGFLYIFGSSIIAGRLLSITASVICSLFLYKIGKKLYNEKAGIFASALFLFSPVTLMWSVLLETEIVQAMFLSIAFYYFIKGIGDKKKWYFLLSGIIIGLSVFVRRTSAILYLSEVLFIIIISKWGFGNKIEKKNAISFIFLLTIGLLSIFMIIFAFFSHIAGFDYMLSTFIKGSSRGSSAEIFPIIPKIPWLIIRGFYLIILLGLFIGMIVRKHFSPSLVLKKIFPNMAYLFLYIFIIVLYISLYYKTSLPYFYFISMIGISIIISMISKYNEEKPINNFEKKPILFLKENKYSIIFIFSIALLLFLDPNIYNEMEKQFLLLIYIITIGSGIFLLSRMPTKEFKYQDIMIFSWLFILLLFYLNYGMFSEIYFYEFFAPLCLIGGVVIEKIYNLNQTKKIFSVRNGRKFFFTSIIIFAMISQSLIFNIEAQYSKTNFSTPSDVSEVAEYIANNTKASDEIFTGSCVIAVESNRFIVNDISHPFIYKFPELYPPFKDIGYPNIKELEKNIDEKKIKYSVIHPLTTDYYFSKNPEFEKYIYRNYHLEKRIGVYDILKRSDIGDYRISKNLINSTFPTAITDASNNIHIFWQEGENNNSEIYYSKFDFNGKILIDSKRITPASHSQSLYCKVTIDSNGFLHLIWEEKFQTHSNIYYTKINKNGEKTVAPKPITKNIELGTYSTFPQIIADSIDNIHIVWSWAYKREENFDIFYSKLDSNGNILVDNTPLTNNLANCHNDSIAIDDEDNIHIVWQDGRDGDYQIYYSKIDGKIDKNGKMSSKNELTLINDIRVSSLNDESLSPDICFDNGKIYVVWYDVTNEDKANIIHYLAMDKNGKILIKDMALTLNSYYSDNGKEMINHATNPSIGVKDGKICITWQDDRWDGKLIVDEIKTVDEIPKRYNNIYYKILDNKGKTLKQDKIISYYESPSITPDIIVENNQFHIVWSDKLIKNYDIFHKKIDID